MITKLYALYDTPFDHDVCHIFEHVVLRTFLLELRKKHYNRMFFGWLRGQTIDSTIFFNIGAYSSDVKELFETHLKALSVFDADVVDQSIRHIEAETGSIIKISDKDLLSRQFEQLINVIKGVDVDATVPVVSPLVIKEKASQFYDIAILVNIYGDVNIKKAFMVLYSQILDLVRDAAIDYVSAYPTGKSAIAVNDEGIGIGWRFRAKNDVDVKALESGTTTYLQGFRLDEHIKGIDEYRVSFNEDPAINDMLISLYEQTGIQFTRDELTQLITKENFSKILNNMTVRFSIVSGKLNRLDWDY